jgi:hypothetical protein
MPANCSAALFTSTMWPSMRDRHAGLPPVTCVAAARAVIQQVADEVASLPAGLGACVHVVQAGRQARGMCAHAPMMCTHDESSNGAESPCDAPQRLDSHTDAAHCDYTHRTASSTEALLLPLLPWCCLTSSIHLASGSAAPHWLSSQPPPSTHSSGPRCLLCCLTLSVKMSCEVMLLSCSCNLCR